MMEIQDQLKRILDETKTTFRYFDLPDSYVERIERLIKEVYEPCIVAVVGRVKAGKSTFINALLGQDLAKVGTTETTATINMFRYGSPDSERPVRCHWRSGHWTDEDSAFLDSLQGNDEETLRRADDIKYLEYRLPYATLRQVSLVDTPGLMALVEEHQDRVAEFLKLEHQLRERHDQETKEYGNSADAVIYLIGSVARADDQALLAEFTHVTRGSSRAYNAIGVMAKIDLQTEILERRHELADKVSKQLTESLNTVVPVSAGLKRAIDKLKLDNQPLLYRLMGVARQIPAEEIDKLLSNEEFFLDLPASVSQESREELLSEFADIPWTVFTTIVRAAVNPERDEDELLLYLEELAGFKKLDELLKRHFIRRGTLLRSYRILEDARTLLRNIEFDYLDKHRQEIQENVTQLQNFKEFVAQASGDPTVASELQDYLDDRADKLNSQIDLSGSLHELRREFGYLYHEMKTHNLEFEALRHLEEDHDLFTDIELVELRSLFGLYGLEINRRLGATTDFSRENIDDRYSSWQLISQRDRASIRRKVAERAAERYAIILDKIPQ